MIKKTLIFSLLALSALGMRAQEGETKTDSIHESHIEANYSLATPLKPTYLRNTVSGFGWGSNWFLEVKGGGTAFLGSPIGCGDLFDRTTPVLQVGIGKWFTPSVGGRIEFQGLEFKNANLQKMSYQFVHADFMYNLTGAFGQNEAGVARWDLIPFAGVGMIRNGDWQNTCKCPGVMSNSHPFAFSYGLQIGYRLSNHLHLIAEVSGMTSTRSFDAIGTSAKFGDTMFSASAGLSVTLGKAGWKRVADARPYIRQNEYLIDRCNLLEKKLRDREPKDSQTDSLFFHNKNDYRGLIALRMRMERSNGLDAPSYTEGQSDLSLDFHPEQSCTGENTLLSDGADNLIDVPVYFYFKKGQSSLVEPSQLSNLDELAKVAKANQLKVTVKGAADSATGTASINTSLSEQRAQYITRELMSRGIAREQIQSSSLGGVDLLSPSEANRNTCVILSH